MTRQKTAGEYLVREASTRRVAADYKRGASEDQHVMLSVMRWQLTWDILGWMFTTTKLRCIIFVC